MATILSGNFPRALMPGVNKWFGMEYTDIPVKYSQVFSVSNSDKNFEEDVSAYGFGLATVKDETGSISYDTAAQGYVKRYVFVDYALGYQISRNALEDNQYPELVSQRSSALGRSMRQTKENVHFNILNRAFSSSYLMADGVKLISTAHIRAKGGTYSNTLSADADLSEASLEQMLINISQAYNESGLRIGLSGQKLIVPTDLMFEAHRITRSELQNDSAYNAINAIRSMGLLPGGVVVSEYLTDADAWFVLTNCPNGAKSIQRRAMEISMDEMDFNTENLAVKATERYAAGVSDVRAFYGTQGA